MKTFERVLVLFAAFAVFTSINFVHAADVEVASTPSPTWEFTGGTSALYAHASSDGKGTHAWNLGAGVDHFFNNFYEIGAVVSYANSSGESFSNTSFEILVGPTFNFFGTPENAYFVTAKAGAYLTSDGNDNGNTSQFTYTVGVGRRVEIVSHVTWKPEVSFVGTNANSSSGLGGNAPSSTDFVITPFQFSLLL